MFRWFLLFFLLNSLLHANAIDLKSSSKLHPGLELNPLSILTLGDTTFFLSTTFSLFDPKNNAEIAMPILWIKEKRSLNYSQNYHNIVYDYDESLLTIDLQYRKYLRSLENGFYFCGFTRYCFIKGKLRYENSIQKTVKFGIGTGLGYRFLPKESKNFYYGFSFNIGRYYGGENDIYDDPFFINDGPYFMDIDFFKFGYIF